jgi:uncharacterized protein YbjT (DUF2867 family)
MIVVAGATGTVGRELVRELSENGAAVRALVRDTAKAGDLRQHGVEVVGADLSLPETLEDPLEGADAAYLLTPSGPRQAELEGNFARAARRSGLGHLVKQSAVGADPQAPEGVGRYHGEAEKVVEESGIPYTYLRPTAFMQNALWYAPIIREKGALMLPLQDVGVGMNMVDVRDVAAVAAAVLTGEGHRGGAYTVTGPEILTFPDLAEKLSAATGRDIEFASVPAEEFREEMEEAGQPESFVEGMISYFSSLSSEDTALSVAPTEVVAEMTGRSPRSFEHFAEDHVEEFNPV